MTLVRRRRYGGQEGGDTWSLGARKQSGTLVRED